jgi:hypothetical protein
VWSEEFVPLYSEVMEGGHRDPPGGIKKKRVEKETLRKKGEGWRFLVYWLKQK